MAAAARRLPALNAQFFVDCIIVSFTIHHFFTVSPPAVRGILIELGAVATQLLGSTQMYAALPPGPPGPSEGATRLHSVPLNGGLGEADGQIDVGFPTVQVRALRG